MRVGRGIGSGKGKTCGRGHKGAGSRSGYTRRMGYEGGQGPLFKKLPIRGFSNAHHEKKMLVFNLKELNELTEGEAKFDRDLLFKKGILRAKNHDFLIKILGTGELTRKITVEANAFSKSALAYLEKEKIEYKIV